MGRYSWVSLRDLRGPLVDELITQLQDYFLDYYNVGYSRKYIERLLNLHENYNTQIIIVSGERIVGYVRWNMVQNTAEVLDMFVEPDISHIGLIRGIIREGVRRFPDLQFVEFERMDAFHNNARSRIYDILKMGKIKE